MSEIAIAVENLSKRYVLSHQRPGGEGLRHVLQEKLRAPLHWLRGRPSQNGSTATEEFWALKDVSFEIKRGEVVGIIGRNGAGKSTLLKILSRITEPTSGRITIEGRVASLLEVGTGFHPELTGRENIYLNGAILGMSRAEIKAKFDEIVAFAEVERFLDTPVKRYSSGMYVRLAFAVAAHMDPEILIVDEVLAVGDAEFQTKCLGKMQDASAKEGRSVLFVSHNMEALTALTTNCILLEKGCIADIGPTRQIVANYLGAGNHAGLVYTAAKTATTPVITRVEVKASASNNLQRSGESMEIEIDCCVPHPIHGARLEVHACDESLHHALYVYLYDSSERRLFPKAGEYTITCRLPTLRLYPGRYTLLVHLAERFGGRLFQRLEGICPFQVIMRETRDGGWVPGDAAYMEDAEWVMQPRPLQP